MVGVDLVLWTPRWKQRRTAGVSGGILERVQRALDLGDLHYEAVDDAAGAASLAFAQKV